MKITRWAMAAIVATTLAGTAYGGSLGDKATALEIKDWVKGKPVDVTGADGKNVYVLEFWATWCGPCRYSIPHLTEMQEKYKDKNVTFIGISDEDTSTVRKYVKEMGDKMGYTVAVDKNKATSEAYMGTFGIRGIPHAFIIDQHGKVAWHDHPMANLDEVLDQVLAGKFDVNAARKLEARRAEERQELEKLFKQADEYFQLVQSADNRAKAVALGEKLAEAAAKQPQFLNSIAWTILTRDGIAFRDLKLALRAAETANTATNGINPGVLDTYALALFENGHKKEAVKTQEQAVKLAMKSGDKRMRDELKGRLDKFRDESE